jgi:hypothetical protein
VLSNFSLAVPVAALELEMSELAQLSYAMDKK